MGTKRPRKGGGGKLTRSQIVTVRLDARLRYLAELGARKQRRTISSFIEWAIEESLETVVLREAAREPGPGSIDAMLRGVPPVAALSVADEAEVLWDVDESERLARLALRYPELLTHEEQLLWKAIWTNDYFWGGADRPEKGATDPEQDLDLDSVREHWADLIAVGRGEKDRSVLPSFDSPNSKDDLPA